jgi:hypothetical protein
MNRVYKILSHIKTQPVAKMNHAMNPEAPKECQECGETKEISQFRKYPTGKSSDYLCLECRKIVEKQKRLDRKKNPPPPIQVEPPCKRGRPKKIVVEEVKQEVKEVDNREEVKETHRTCTMCNETKQLTAEFYHRKKDNWFTACKLCRNTKRNELYRTSENYRRQKLEYQKNYSPSYYQNNKKKLDEYHKLYRHRKRELEKQAKELKKQEEFQKLIRDEARKMLQNGGIEILN